VLKISLKAKKYYETAARLGFVYAARDLGRILDVKDPLRYKWLGKAAVAGNNWE
jgi:hypothetical protein